MPESFPNKETASIQEIFVDEEKLNRTATDLFERNRDEILTHKENYYGRNSIPDALKQFPDEVLQNYWGHGVTRGDKIRNIVAALSMLQNNAFMGSTARLANSGHIDAWTDGDFLAISRRGELLSPRLNNQAQRVEFKTNSGQTKPGLQLDLGALIITDRLEPIIDDLREMFPQAKIISAAELPDYINEQENDAQPEDIGEDTEKP